MIGATRYMGLVRDYALAHGLPFFTIREQRKALARYELFASQKN